MIYLSRKEHFNAAHKLFNPTWSLEKNKEVFGACANENFHGHNFELIVTVKGEIDLETGFCINLKTLSKLIREEVTEKLDHKNLNMDVDFLSGKMASTENLAMGIWNILSPKIKAISGACTLYSVKIYETPRNFVEYLGG